MASPGILDNAEKSPEFRNSEFRIEGCDFHGIREVNSRIQAYIHLHCPLTTLAPVVGAPVMGAPVVGAPVVGAPVVQFQS